MDCIHFLENKQHSQLAEEFTAITEGQQYKRISNPDWHDWQGTRLFTYFTGQNLYRTRWLADGGSRIDLRTQWGLDNMSDTRFFEQDNKLFLTFCRKVSEGVVRVFVAQIKPTIEAPVEADYNRQERVEKNWAFYTTGGVEYCLYSVNPLTVLVKMDGYPWKYKHHYEGPNLQGEWGIGSQLQQTEEGKWGFMVNRRYKHKGKKAYVGVYAELQHKDNIIELQIGNKYYGHSFSTYLGKERPIGNLLGLTYFSGAGLIEGKFCTSYGINDRGVGFAELN